MGKAETAIKTRESVATRKERCKKIIRGLKKLYPDAECALTHDSALQLLVATILSAQSTDETVNKVTPVLFDKYPTAAEIAEADPADVEEIIHSTGFFPAEDQERAESVCSDRGETRRGGAGDDGGAGRVGRRRSEDCQRRFGDVVWQERGGRG